MLFKKSKDLVGIDIGSSSVKMVQLSESRGKFQLVACGMARLPAGAVADNVIVDRLTVVRTIRELLSTHKVVTPNVAAAVSGHTVIFRTIRLPVMNEEQLAATIEWEAEQYIPYQIADVNLDTHVLGPVHNDPKQMDVVLVAAKKEIVNSISSLFAECQLNLQVIDVDCFALANLLEVCYDLLTDEVVAMVDLGAGASSVTMVQGGVPIFTREIPFGGSTFVDDLQRRLALDRDEAAAILDGGDVSEAIAESVQEVLADTCETLGREIQRTLDFFYASSLNERPRNLFLVGGVIQATNLRDTLARSLGIEVEILNPWSQISIDKKRFDAEQLATVGPQYAVAVGLAMRRVEVK